MLRASLRIHWLLASLACGWFAQTAAADHHCQTIAAARASAVGSTVSISGEVTVPTGAFDSGFAIQQGQAGIYVLDSGTEHYALGEQVTVDGVLVDSTGLLAVQPNTIRRSIGHEVIHARHRSTGAVGEASEGQLLRLKGKLIGDPVDDSPYGWKLTLDDGSGPIQVFLYPGTGITNVGLTAGSPLTVTCFSSQYDTHYECDPRTPDDLKLSQH